MRSDGATPPSSSTSASSASPPAKPFAQTLHQLARPKAPPSVTRGKLLAPARALAAQGRLEPLASMKAGPGTGEPPRVVRRQEAEKVRPERHRVAEILAHHLFAPEPKPAATEPSTNPTSSGEWTSSDAGAFVNQIESVLERVELLAKAEGPSLELGLSDGRAEKIEVVRAGQGEVKVRLSARSPAERRALAGQASSIRKALASRGLVVRELTIA